MPRERGWQEYVDSIAVDLLGEQEDVAGQVVRDGNVLRWGAEGGEKLGYRGMPLEVGYDHDE